MKLSKKNLIVTLVVLALLAIIFVVYNNAVLSWQ